MYIQSFLPGWAPNKRKKALVSGSQPGPLLGSGKCGSSVVGAPPGEIYRGKFVGGKRRGKLDFSKLPLDKKMEMCYNMKGEHNEY